MRNWMVSVPYLKHLSVPNSMFGLDNCWASCTTLHSLDLEACQVPYEDLDNLSLILPKCTQLVDLNLSCLADMGAGAFFTDIPLDSLSQLLSLSLKGNFLGSPESLPILEQVRQGLGTRPHSHQASPPPTAATLSRLASCIKAHPSRHSSHPSGNINISTST